MLTATTTVRRGEDFQMDVFWFCLKGRSNSRRNFIWKSFFHTLKVLAFMTFVQSDEYPNARNNQQRFRKRPEKSHFFPDIFQKVCWLQNMIHKVGFLSLHTNGGVEWRGSGQADQADQREFSRRTGAQSSLSPSTQRHCSCRVTKIINMIHLEWSKSFILLLELPCPSCFYPI